MLAQFGDATENSLIIIVKNKQSAIPKDQIERIDYRPGKGTKVRVTSSNKTEDPAVNPKTPYDSHVPSTSYSAGIGNGSKSDFEILYERPRPSPK